MAIRSGFYNGADRPYYTTEFSKLFNLLIKDGVIMHYGGKLLVGENSGMKVEVDTGYAWFHSTWTDNNSILVLPIGPSAPQTSRIDAVVIKIDTRNEGRVNDIIVLPGTPNVSPVKPSMVTGIEGVYYVPLAYVTVKPLVQEITASDIENVVGTDETPFVTGILDTLSLTELMDQYEKDLELWFDDADNQLENIVNAAETDMDAWRAAFKKQNEDWSNTFTADMENFRTTEQQLWDAWFANLQSNLTGDVAGNLQAQISNLEQDVADINAERVVYYNKTLVAANWLKIADDEYNITLSLGSVNLSKFIPDVIFANDPTLESTLSVKSNNGNSITFSTSIRPTINLTISTITLDKDKSDNPAIGRVGTHNIIPPSVDISGLESRVTASEHKILGLGYHTTFVNASVGPSYTPSGVDGYKYAAAVTPSTSLVNHKGLVMFFSDATIDKYGDIKAIYDNGAIKLAFNDTSGTNTIAIDYIMAQKPIT